MRKYKIQTWNKKMRRVERRYFEEASFGDAVARAQDEIGPEEILCMVSMPLKTEEVDASPTDVS